jgi:hypothetical protein
MTPAATGINNTGGHRYQQHRRQILPPVLLVPLIPVANLPLVSLTPACIVDINGTSGTGGKICRWCR